MPLSLISSIKYVVVPKVCTYKSYLHKPWLAAWRRSGLESSQSVRNAVVHDDSMCIVCWTHWHNCYKPTQYLYKYKWKLQQTFQSFFLSQSEAQIRLLSGKTQLSPLRKTSFSVPFVRLENINNGVCVGRGHNEIFMISTIIDSKLVSISVL
jgi:hypothetical protein